MGYDISYDHLVGWEADLRLLTERVTAGLFTRPEPRGTFADLVRGLLADVPRKNSWQLAEHVGHGSAYRLEWLLGGAKWDADILRDRVRDYVVDTLIRLAERRNQLRGFRLTYAPPLLRHFTARFEPL